MNKLSVTLLFLPFVAGFSLWGIANTNLFGLPVVSPKSSTVIRDHQQTTNCCLFIQLSQPSELPVSFHYSTVDGTAIANKDYLPVQGTLILQPLQTSALIEVTVIGNGLKQGDQNFYVQLSSPVNATLSGNGSAMVTIQNRGIFAPRDETGYYTPLFYPCYQLVWSDEFNGTSLDPANWNYETGGNGWGNRELEYYTAGDHNAYLADGNLVIEARKETIGNNHYTSARLTTANKRTFTYGRIDIRAKLPIGKGIWPALWMLGVDRPTVSWPACGEADIMELIGSVPNQIYGSVHWAKTIGGSGLANSAYLLKSGDFSQKYHVFSMIWWPEHLQFLVDGSVYLSVKASDVLDGRWPFDHPFYFIFSLAVGGSWPGNPDETTLFPQRMYIDYIRVFQ